MRPVSSGSSSVSLFLPLFPILAWTGILILALNSLAAAPQQDNAAQPAASATLSQALSDCAAATQRHDYDAARQAALQATAIDPQNQSAWFCLAWSYHQLGDLPKAEEAYKNLIALSPRHTAAYNNLAGIYRRTGRIDEAIASYRKQIEVAPRGHHACWNLALLLASRGEWAEARDLAAVATELTPNDVNRWQFLGKAQIKTGRTDEARQSFDRALALPHQAMLENNVAYDMADAGIDVDKSWHLISKALEATAPTVCQPEGLYDGDKCTAPLRQMAYMLDTAGWVLYRQGKAKEAEPYLRSSFAITPRSETELHMAVVLAKSDRLDEAVNLFAQARTRPDFDRVDSHETMRELEKAVGGDAELDALLGHVPLAPPLVPAAAKAVALVDGNGKVIDVRAIAPPFPGLAEVAKSLTLPVLSWPGYSIRSIRTIEFQRTGAQWSPSDSYAGETPPPPPCGSIPPRPVLVTQMSTPATPQMGCPGAY
jgi:tetratricopeptide (TPR) repeat protein